MLPELIQSQDLFRPPPGLEFFQRFPKEEARQFNRLMEICRQENRPLPIVCPVCPDYLGHYRLGDGAGKTAGKALNRVRDLQHFFKDRGLAIFIQIHLADVEALDPLILQLSGETAESFFDKTRQSREVIKQKIGRMDLESVVAVSSMAESFTQAGLDYISLLQENEAKIRVSDSRKVRRTKEALVTERQKLGDFDRLNPAQIEAMAITELANYSAYGDLVNGQAVILSPDALSAVPAYNFLRGGEKLFNPTIYVKKR